MTTEEVTWDALKLMPKGPIEQTKETDRLICELRKIGKETEILESQKGPNERSRFHPQLGRRAP